MILQITSRLVALGVIWAGSDLTGLGLPVSTLTPAGLLAVVIILIAMGRLVPRRTMEDVIHDRNEWRAAHRISETARIQDAETLHELLDALRSLDAFIRAIPAGVEGAQQQHIQQPAPPKE